MTGASARHALRATLAALLLAMGLMLGTGAVAPRVAVACSCVGPQPLARYADQDTVIFAGTVIGDDGDGVAVGVEHWFSGIGPAPVVVISGDFGNGASCGVGARPEIGSSWIWVAWRPPDEDLPDVLDNTVQINICQPFATLSTPEGAALLQEAIATFGEGDPIPSGAPSPDVVESPPATPATPAAPVTTVVPTRSPVADAGPPRETVALAAAGLTILLGVALLGLVLLVGRRRRRADGQPPG